MTKLTAAEKKQQRNEEWLRKNAKTVELFLFLKDIVQAANPKIEDFELEGYTYVEPDDRKPIPSFRFENARRSRIIGIHGHDSDIDGRFYIHAVAPKKIDLYIQHYKLTAIQQHDLKVKLDAAVAEQVIRREDMKTA